MKLIFNGAEYYLSSYLNAIKIPMVLFLVISLIICVMEMERFDMPKKFNETFLGRHLKLYLFLCFVFGAYMFLVWN